MMSKESRKGNVGGKVLAVFVAVCLLGDIGVNVYHMQKETASDSKVSKFIDKELKRQAEEKKKENEYIEDGYKVSEEYEIRSTKDISDAYLSGDDSKLNKEDKKTLEMAKEILEKAGWKLNYGMWQKDGMTIELKLVVSAENEARLKASNIIKEQLEEIGIKVTIRELSNSYYKNNLSKLIKVMV